MPMDEAGARPRASTPAARWSLTTRMLLVALAATHLPLAAVAVYAIVTDLSRAATLGLVALASMGGTACLLVHLRVRLLPLDAASRRLRRFVNLGILEVGGPYPDDELGRLLAEVDDVCARLDDARQDRFSGGRSAD